MRRDALLGDEAFERLEPVPVVSVAGIGVAFGLRPLDLRAERLGPFRSGEQAASVQRQGYREGLRFPRLAEDRAALVARQARQRRDRLGEVRVMAHAGP